MHASVCTQDRCTRISVHTGVHGQTVAHVCVCVCVQEWSLFEAIREKMEERKVHTYTRTHTHARARTHTHRH